MTNGLNQVQGDAWGSTDPTMAISWDRVIYETEPDLVCMFARWGPGSSSAPTFSLPAVSWDSDFQSFEISGTIGHPAAETVSVFVMLDSNLSMLEKISSDTPPGQYSETFTRPASWNLSYGAHNLTFYALSDLGTFSPDIPNISLYRSRPASPPPASPSEPNSGDNTLVWIVIGCVIGAIVLIAGTVIVIGQCRRASNRAQVQGSEPAQAPVVIIAPSMGYGFPPPAQGYGSPPPGPGYAGPPTAQGYAFPLPAEGYSMSAPAQGYAAPPSSQACAALPPAQGYAFSPPGQSSGPPAEDVTGR
jgi:hypothetical protein